MALGSRYEVRQPGLPAAVYEVTDWQPGRSFTWAVRSVGLRSTATHTVSADGDGSRLDLSFEWTGPLAPVMRLLLAAKGRRLVDVEAQTFARLAETR